MPEGTGITVQLHFVVTGDFEDEVATVTVEFDCGVNLQLQCRDEDGLRRWRPQSEVELKSATKVTSIRVGEQQYSVATPHPIVWSASASEHQVRLHLDEKNKSADVLVLERGPEVKLRFRLKPPLNREICSDIVGNCTELQQPVPPEQDVSVQMGKKGSDLIPWNSQDCSGHFQLTINGDDGEKTCQLLGLKFQENLQSHHFVVTLSSQKKKNKNKKNTTTSPDNKSAIVCTCFLSVEVQVHFYIVSDEENRYESIEVVQKRDRFQLSGSDGGRTWKADKVIDVLSQGGWTDGEKLLITNDKNAEQEHRLLIRLPQNPSRHLRIRLDTAGKQAVVSVLPRVQVSLTIYVQGKPEQLLRHKLCGDCQELEKGVELSKVPQAELPSGLEPQAGAVTVKAEVELQMAALEKLLRSQGSSEVSSMKLVPWEPKDPEKDVVYIWIASRDEKNETKRNETQQRWILALPLNSEAQQYEFSVILNLDDKRCAALVEEVMTLHFCFRIAAAADPVFVHGSFGKVELQSLPNKLWIGSCEVKVCRDQQQLRTLQGEQLQVYHVDTGHSSSEKLDLPLDIKDCKELQVRVDLCGNSPKVTLLPLQLAEFTFRFDGYEDDEHLQLESSCQDLNSFTCTRVEGKLFHEHSVSIVRMGRIGKNLVPWHPDDIRSLSDRIRIKVEGDRIREWQLPVLWFKKSLATHHFVVNATASSSPHVKVDLKPGVEVNLHFRVVKPEDTEVTVIIVSGDCQELQRLPPLTCSEGDSRIFSAKVPVQMCKAGNKLVPWNPQDIVNKTVTFQLEARYQNKEAKKEQWTLPKLIFKEFGQNPELLQTDDTADNGDKSSGKKSGTKMDFVVNVMNWAAEPPVLKSMSIDLDLLLRCWVRCHEYMTRVTIDSNFNAEPISLTRASQEKKPNQNEPGIEQWKITNGYTVYTNGNTLVNIDGEPLEFTKITIIIGKNRDDNSPRTEQIDLSRLRLPSDPTRKKIQYEVKVTDDYSKASFAAGVSVTLHFACQCDEAKQLSLCGNCIEFGNDEFAKTPALEVRKEGQASTGLWWRELTIKMFRHGRRLLLPKEKELRFRFAKSESDTEEKWRELPLHCGSAFSDYEFYYSAEFGKQNCLPASSPIEVQLKFSTKHNMYNERGEVYILGNCNELGDRGFKTNKKENNQLRLKKNRDSGDPTHIWSKKFTLKMFPRDGELFLSGGRWLRVKRGVRQNGQNKDLDKEDHVIRLFSDHPSDSLQFQIDILSATSHRVFPLMPMNQLPKDSILQYFQSALRKALPDFPPELTSFATIRDVFAKRLVPLIKQSGDYDAEDGASRPHEFHDIWGEDPESDKEEEAEEDVLVPRSAMKYVQQKRHRNPHSVRKFTQHAYHRLSRQYHAREEKVFHHLNEAARKSQDQCLQLHKRYTYRGNDLCENDEAVLHDDYIDVLMQIAGKITSSDCRCQLDAKLVMQNAAAVVRGRLEAFLVCNTSDMLSDLFYYDWKRHTEAAGSWFVLLVAVWWKCDILKKDFYKYIKEDRVPVPAFFRWSLESPGCAKCLQEAGRRSCCTQTSTDV